jgi:thiol-disulfide isomerase/thioredoxin
MLARIRRPPPAVGILIVCALALSACGRSPTVAGSRGPEHSKPQTEAAARRARGQAGQLLGGGTTAFRRRLASLRGAPVVVNQWASWCGPCRFEFPFFQRLSKRYEGRVAFLGVDAKDARSDAAAFLKKFPVPYPHYYDQDASIARTFGGGRAWPTTAFFAASGRLAFTHIGAYATEAKLNDDIVKYALHG